MSQPPATQCSLCGDCCDPVWYPLSPADIRQGAVTATGSSSTDLRFAAAHWAHTGAVDEDGRYAYACDRFDAQTRRCTAHDERPPICRGYPWYDGATTLLVLLPTRCAFRADLP